MIVTEIYDLIQMKHVDDHSYSGVHTILMIEHIIKLLLLGSHLMQTKMLSD